MKGRYDMKRKFIPIAKAPEVAGAYCPETNRYEWWLVDIENMGFCEDGITRWYWFTAEDGTPCYTLKH